MKRVLWFQKAGIVCVSILCHFLYRFRVEGRENIPLDGCVVCANHSSGLDPILLGTAMTARYPLALMAKKELFEPLFLGCLLTALGAFPVDRGSADLSAIKNALYAIQQGEKFVIFPQGTRSGSGDSAAKAGAGMVALRSHASVVPVYISPNKKIFGKITIRIGPSFIPTMEGPKDAQRYERVAEQIMSHIYALGEEHNA